MRLLLISVNKQKSFRPVLPVGMAIIAAQARRAGHQVECLDLCFETEDERVIKQHLDGSLPDAIGISIRNVDSQNYLEPTYYLPFVLQVARWCREVAGRTPLILGGAGFSQLPQEIMKYTRADFGISGFGERSLPELLDRLQTRRDPTGISGLLSWAADGTLREDEPDYTMDYAAVAPVDRCDYDPRYFAYGYQTHGEDQRCVEAIQTKKGCVLDCIFCGNFKVEGRSVILKPVSSIVDEIEAIAINGGGGFEFVDGVFNLPLQHALNVCREMRRRNIYLPWSCQLNPAAVTPELVDLMVATGCRHVEFGTDSGSDTILSRLRKNFRRDQVVRAHRLVAAQSLEVIHCVFLGAPGETRQTVDETLSLLDQLVPPDAPAGNQAYISLGMRICEGSTLHQIAIADGTLSAESTLGVPRFYVAPSVIGDVELLSEIEQRVCANNRWYLWWGLPTVSLRDRVAEVSRLEGKVERLYLAALDNGVLNAY